MTVAGTVETFDAASFAAGLAASVGVEAAAVTLTVTAGSVRVDATILVVDPSTSVVASVQALANNVTALSQAVGVTVETVAPPVVSMLAVDAPLPPPSPLPPSEPLSPAPPHLSPPPLYTALIAAEEAGQKESPAISAAIGSLIGFCGLCLVVCVLMAVRVLKTRQEFKVWLVDAKRKEQELEAPLPVSINTLSPLPNVVFQGKGSLDAQEEVGVLMDEVIGEQVGAIMAEVAEQELAAMKDLVSKELSPSLDNEQVDRESATAVAETPPQRKSSIGASGRRRRKHSAFKEGGSSTGADSVIDAAPNAAAALRAAISPRAEISPEFAFLRRLSKESVGADAAPRMAVDTSVAESAVSASEPLQRQNSKGTLMPLNLAASGAARYKTGASTPPPMSNAAPPESDAAVHCVRRGSKGCMVAAFSGSFKSSADGSAAIAAAAAAAAVPPAVPDSAPSQSAPLQRRSSKSCLMAATAFSAGSFKSSADGSAAIAATAAAAAVPPAVSDSAPSQSAPLQRRNSRSCLMAATAFSAGSFKSSAKASNDGYGGSFKVSADEVDKPPTRFYAASDATPFASAPLQRRGSKELMVAAESFKRKSGAGDSAADADAAAVAPAAEAGAIAGLTRARAAKAAADAEASAAAAPSASAAAASETPPPPPPRRRKSRSSSQPPSAGGSSTATSPSTAGGSVPESGRPRHRVSRSSCVSPTPEVGAATPTRVSRAPDLLGTRAQVGSSSAGDLASLDDVNAPGGAITSAGNNVTVGPPPPGRSRKKHETATSDAGSSASSTLAI